MTKNLSQHIILTTVNARYTHSPFGLRRLWANLGIHRQYAEVMDFHLGQPASQIAETILKKQPKIIGFGVYIWNVRVMTELVQIIKGVNPEIILILGGPEVSYEYEEVPIFHMADYLIRGEAEIAFRDLIDALLQSSPCPIPKVINATPPALESLASPYEAYTDDDLAGRRIYVETSRGCPFKCEFCLSSLDNEIRAFPLASFFDSMEQLINRGVLHFKFIDRSFNVRPQSAYSVMDFFLERWKDGMQLHFEITPDFIPDAYLQYLQRFPPQGLHLEIGIQSFHPSSLTAISRRTNIARIERNLRKIRTQTHSLIHADLIAGLPFETLESFAEGFDKLFALNPHVIQVGILKRLRGAPINRHTHSCKIVYSEEPPYEVLQTAHLDFIQLQKIKRFARYYDLYANSGEFPESLIALTQHASAFKNFMDFSDFIWEKTHRTHELSLVRQTQLLHEFLTKYLYPTTRFSELSLMIERDFRRISGRRDKLDFLSESSS